MARLDPERLAVLRSLQLATAVVERRLEVALADDHDLPLSWFEVLAALQDAGGRLRMNELAERVMTITSSLSRQLSRMEQEGHVRRDRSDEDGRGVVIVLTPGGRAIWRQAAPTYRRVAHRAFCVHLTDTDVVALSRVTSKVMQGE
jgi:DNA-binding MarR family transcriptional regulator